MPNYVVYQVPTGTQRLITVVEGQPFYRSTGKNSKNPGIWFPFIMVRGTHPLLFDEKTLPKYFHSKRIESNTNRKSTYLIKFHNYVNRKHPDILNDVLKKNPKKHELKEKEKKFLIKLCFKKLLFVSAQLTDAKSMASKIDILDLTKDERRLVLNTSKLKLELDPKQPIIKYPDDLNAWLIAQGAKNLLLPMKKVEVEEKKSPPLVGTLFETKKEPEPTTDKEKDLSPRKKG